MGKIKVLGTIPDEKRLKTVKVDGVVKRLAEDGKTWSVGGQKFIVNPKDSQLIFKTLSVCAKRRHIIQAWVRSDLILLGIKVYGNQSQLVETVGQKTNFYF